MASDAAPEPTPEELAELLFGSTPPVARTPQTPPIVAPKTRGPAELLRSLKVGEAYLCIGYNRSSVRVIGYRLAPRRFVLSDVGDEFQVRRVADGEPPQVPKQIAAVTSHKAKARQISQIHGGPLAFVRGIRIGQVAAVSPHNPASVKSIVTKRQVPGRFEVSRARVRGRDVWAIRRLA